MSPVSPRAAGRMQLIQRKMLTPPTHPTPLKTEKLYWHCLAGTTLVYSFALQQVDLIVS
jgi:hypothetical protein